MKKTYFLAWETDNKRGHFICEFEKGDIGYVTPRKALNYMITQVEKIVDKDNVGLVKATQFNNVV